MRPYERAGDWPLGQSVMMMLVRSACTRGVTWFHVIQRACSGALAVFVLSLARGFQCGISKKSQKLKIVCTSLFSANKGICWPRL